MKMSALILTVILTMTATVLFIAPARSQDNATTARKVPQADGKVKELQKQRLVVLQTMADVMDALFRQARVDADRLYKGKQLLLTAEVELAENDADRVKLYEKFVDMMKKYEELAAVRKQAAEGTELDILKAKAIRLEAEIALEKVKAKIAK
jgi:hypothetical protein